jgi:hypothetical protein
LGCFSQIVYQVAEGCNQQYEDEGEDFAVVVSGVEGGLVAWDFHVWAAAAEAWGGGGVIWWR